MAGDIRAEECFQSVGNAIVPTHKHTGVYGKEWEVYVQDSDN